MELEIAIEGLEEVSPKHPACSSKGNKYIPHFL